MDEVIAILDAAEAGLEQIIGFTVCRKVDLPPKQERKLLYLVLWQDFSCFSKHDRIKQEYRGYNLGYLFKGIWRPLSASVDSTRALIL